MKTCIICKRPVKGYGNNAWPVADGTCCNACNFEVVLPARIKRLYESGRKEQKPQTDDEVRT